MVFYGGFSKGCVTCLKRRIKVSIPFLAVCFSVCTDYTSTSVTKVNLSAPNVPNRKESALDTVMRRHLPSEMKDKQQLAMHHVGVTESEAKTAASANSLTPSLTRPCMARPHFVE